jgi:hypothetical protein
MAGLITPTVEYRPRPDVGWSSRLTGRMLDMHIAGCAVCAEGAFEDFTKRGLSWAAIENIQWRVQRMSLVHEIQTHTCLCWGPKLAYSIISNLTSLHVHFHRIKCAKVNESPMTAKCNISCLEHSHFATSRKKNDAGLLLCRTTRSHIKPVHRSRWDATETSS